MKELSLNILDIAQNSIKAGAKNIIIALEESLIENYIKINIKDDGCGMSEEILAKVTDPFYTSRTTRKVGLGLPLFKMEAEQTGGNFSIESKVKSKAENKAEENSGTQVCAEFKTDNFDAIPLGDIIGTVCVLIQGSPELNFYFSHKIINKNCENINDNNICENKLIELKTNELRETLGDDISLSEPEIINWIKEYLEENYV